MIEIEHLHKSFGETIILNDINLEIAKDRITSLLGPSGSGKTTLLRIIAGLEVCDSGRVIVDGQDITNIPVSRRNMGFVFQNYALFKHLNVAENIAFGLKVRPRGQRPATAEINARVNDLLDLIMLRELKFRGIDELSGGQRQRVALARALAIEPSILLLDEPFGALDAKVREELRTQLLHIQREIGITTIVVTHDQEEAMELSDHIVILNNGRIEQAGHPDEVYDSPCNPFVYDFLGHVNVIPGHVVASFAQPDLSSRDLIFVRPHEVRICPVALEHSFPAAINSVRFLGSRIRVTLMLDAIPDKLITAEVDRRSAQAIGQKTYGERVFLEFPNFKFYDAASASFTAFSNQESWYYNI